MTDYLAFMARYFCVVLALFVMSVLIVGVGDLLIH